MKVVECGSITKAAQELYLSQPSLTKAISSLEAEYDLKLFSRTAKGLSLTPEGRDFLEYAKSVVESSQALDRTFGNRQNNLSIQRLAVASQQLDFIYDILLLLYKENSDELLQIDLKENDRGEIAEMVAECKADIGILVLSEEDSRSFRSVLKDKDLDMYLLDRSSIYVSMGPKSDFYDRDTVDVEETGKYLHVSLDTDQTMRREMRYRKGWGDGVNHEHVIFCNTIGVCRKFLEETSALLLTPKWVLGLFEGTKVRSVPLMKEGRPYPSVNSLVWIKRANEMLRPMEMRFMELLKERFESRAPD
ncbi:MAG: LysR family transcriptional regulator [Lachnospiraceae bacterium]|nr:LysR family transcriptional regulator [Lachnospiraceae bacterium]